MTKFDWNNVTRKHVIYAIEKFLTENPKYPSPRSTYLVYNGLKLPAKHIRGMAYEVAFGTEISKEDYAGGMETIRFFEKRGFETYYTGKLSPPKAKHITEKAIVSSEHPAAEIQDEAPSTPKIKISSKDVIEQKNALQLLLNRMFNGDVVCEKTFDWMKTPTVIEGVYSEVCNALKNYRGDTSFIKKNVSLRCDFAIESQRLIIEYDERQHFSEARRVSLLAYTSIPVYYERDLWISACTSVNAKDNQPKNRDEIRAYYDSVRDILAEQNGYRLIRIMHGQIDFTDSDAQDKLENILNIPQMGISAKHDPNTGIRIALYLQTENVRNAKDFKKAMDTVKCSDADILVFPEVCYTPFIDEFANSDVSNEQDLEEMGALCLNLSTEIEKPIIISSQDKYGTIFSLYANAFATQEETMVTIYVKHTMTDFSAMDFTNYEGLSTSYFHPIILGKHRIGMIICYDCNHALFSRAYGLNDVDIIINSTGGNVVFDKWYKYNQTRAIENNCYTFVTMGGNGADKKSVCCVFGFTPKGKELQPECLNGADTKLHNVPGSIYVYDTRGDDGEDGIDASINQPKTPNKNSHFDIPVQNPMSILKNARKISDNIYVLQSKNENLVFCLVDGDNIMKPEKVLPLLYAGELKKLSNKKYIIVNKHQHIDTAYYKAKLSVVLKVRAMENYCIVLLLSENMTNCYQCGNNRTAQVVAPVDGYYKVDLNRASGPETIWKNKPGMRASWRKNFEYLIDKIANGME